MLLTDRPSGVLAAVLQQALKEKLARCVKVAVHAENVSISDLERFVTSSVSFADASLSIPVQAVF